MQSSPPPPPAGIHGILSVLADAADQATSDRETSSSRMPERLRWIPLAGVEQLRMSLWEPPQTRPLEIGDARAARQMASIDAIRPGEHSLQVGWLWIAGTIDGGDGPRRVFEPLVVVDVSVAKDVAMAVGELQLNSLVGLHGARTSVEAGLESQGPAFGGGAFAQVGAEVDPLLLGRLAKLRSWARHAAAAAGLHTGELVPADAAPSTLASREGLRIVVGLGLFAMDAKPDFSPAGSLRTWHARVGTQWTALHSLYLDRPPPQMVDPGPDLPSAYHLTTAQRECVDTARRAPTTVIAGAPGTGKTHTIAALIGDVVARGQTVLVAARSEAAVEAIAELVARRPGPDPVVFGAFDRRLALARRLAAGHPRTVSHERVVQRSEQLQRALTVRDELHDEVTSALRGLVLMDDRSAARRLQDRLPGLSRPDVSLYEVHQLVAETGLEPPPWYRLGARRRWNRLLDLLGVSSAPDPGDLDDALALVSAHRHLRDAADDLGAGLDTEGLLRAEQDVETAAGQWMDAVARDERRMDRQVRAARGALATALRAGRSTRRAKLAELGPAVTEALPVWLGTLGDIDDLLPMHPAMFDVVVLDEASSIDQPRAATALLRGGRAVIVGDPQQLRHVSFVPDTAVREALDTHLPGASAGLAAKLDVRQNSIFDVATATAAVHHLDEHFRSGAHLFDFVGRELYGDRVRVATVTPLTDTEDQIVVAHQQAARNTAKVVEAEVDWVMARLAALREAGVRSVGVVSPFRAQADAIEARALAELKRRGIEDLGLRVGTVHAFQGMERDVVLVSVGIGTDDGPMSWRFACDPHLFAVMATRARQRIEWVISADPPPGSLIARYLAQGDRPPEPVRDLAPTDPWTAEVVRRVVDTAVPVVAPYPTGRHAVDVCLIGTDTFLAVETTLHRDGPDAHVRRHLELRRKGWPITVALRAVWGERPAELAIRLRDALEHAQLLT